MNKNSMAEKVIRSKKKSRCSDATKLPASKSLCQPPVPTSEPLLSTIDYNSSNNSLFVHSSFRTSSTWLWNKLRGAPTTIAYCEVFHEGMATFDLKAISTTTHTSWRSKHPASAPYFLEFLPLLSASGGIKNYNATMAFDSFIPANGVDGHLSLEEQKYLAYLIHHAERNRCIPVLTDTRTLGRAKAIQKSFSGKNIFLHRNLFHQWASYSSQAISGNPYFFQTIGRTLSGSKHDPIMRLLSEWFGVPESAEDARFFQLFLLMHLYLYAHAYDAADIIIDMSAMSEDARLRHSIECELSSLVSHRIDLSDVRLDFGQSTVKVESVPDFLDTIEQFTKLIAGTGVSEASMTFVNEMSQRAIEEWRRHELFTREYRESMHAKIDATNVFLEESKANANMICAERDKYAASLAEAAASRGSLQATLAAVSAQRDEQAVSLAQAVAVQDALEETIVEVTAQRDEHAAKLADAAAALDGLRETVAAVTAQRDEHAARLADAAAARDGWRETVAAVTAQRDEHAARLAEVAAALDGWRETVAAVTAQRDEHAARLAEVAAALDGLRETVTVVTAQRDEHAARFADAAAARDGLQEIVAAVTAQRDEHAARLAEAAAARDGLRETVAMLTDKVNRSQRRHFVFKYLR